MGFTHWLAITLLRRRGLLRHTEDPPLTLKDALKILENYRRNYPFRFFWDRYRKILNYPRGPEDIRKRFIGLVEKYKVELPFFVRKEDKDTLEMAAHMVAAADITSMEMGEIEELKELLKGLGDVKKRNEATPYIDKIRELVKKLLVTREFMILCHIITELGVCPKECAVRAR